MATGKAKLGALAGALALSFALLPLACALALLAVAVALLRSRVRMRARAPEVGPLAGVAPIGVMRARHSWRSYSDRVPSDDQLDALRRFAADPAVRTGPIAGSRVDVVFVRSDALSGRQQLGTYGFVSGAKCFAVGVLREGQALEDFGAVFERVVLEAVRMGLCTCWLGGSFNGALFHKAATDAGVVFAPGDKVFVVSPLGYPADDNSVYRAVMLGNMVDIKSGRTPRHPLSKLFFDRHGSPLDLPALGCPALAEAAEAVQIAPSGLNRQPWRVVRESDGVWHFFAVPGAVAVYALLASNDCGIAACHWEQTLASHGLRGSWKVLAPADVAVAKPSPDCVYKFSWVSNSN
eukprot:m51a1_g6480 hypothetical protein (350) ;mRNA; r:118473-119732